MDATCDDPHDVLGTLQLVLEHFSGLEGNQQLYNTTARGLHRASKQCKAAARGTLRKLRLDRCYNGLVRAYPDPAQRPGVIPWDLLTACPAATSWVVHKEQLAAFSPNTVPQLMVAASNLKRLEVTFQDGHTSVYMFLTPPSDMQQRGLGRLLWAATGLEELVVNSYIPNPEVVLDPDSTNNAMVPAPPLRILRTYTVHHGFLTQVAHLSLQTGPSTGVSSRVTELPSSLSSLQKLTCLCLRHYNRCS
jgi:hypothetical protein